jgi:hypothetical protein
MRKTITNFLALAGSLLCLFILGACPPDAGSGGDDTNSSENTEAVVVKNIPPKVNGKDTYKVYVQLSTGMSAAAGYVAKGEALISNTQATQESGNTYTVTITELKDPDGNPWKGSNNKSVNVVIRPQMVAGIDDMDAKGNMKSSSKTLVLDWKNNLISVKSAISEEDYQKLYEDIVVKDGVNLSGN